MRPVGDSGMVELNDLVGLFRLSGFCFLPALFFVEFGMASCSFPVL